MNPNDEMSGKKGLLASTKVTRSLPQTCFEADGGILRRQSRESGLEKGLPGRYDW